MQSKPVYISQSCAKSLWNEYRVYDEYIELDAWIFFKTFIIYHKDIVSIRIYEPPVIKTKFWALKLDMADFNLHVGIERKKGFIKHVRFTPGDPARFVQEVNRFIIV